MGIFDKAKDLAGQNPDAVNQGLDQAGDFLNERTGGQFADQIQQGQEFARGHLGQPGVDGAQPAGEPPVDQPPVADEPPVDQ